MALPGSGEADKETDLSKIAAAFTKYYAPLFANKPIDQRAKAKALKTLRKGNRVLLLRQPPSAMPISRVFNGLLGGDGGAL